MVQNFYHFFFTIKNKNKKKINKANHKKNKIKVENTSDFFDVGILISASFIQKDGIL